MAEWATRVSDATPGFDPRVEPAAPVPRYIFLQNIFTPYRISLFDELHRAGFPFEVFYMRYTEADRHWTIDRGAIRHPHYLDRGFYRMVGRFHVHINPRLLLRMIRERDAEFILGASWNDLNVMFLVLLKRLGLLRQRVHFWSEANHLTIGSSKDNWLKRALRKFVFDGSRGAIVIPGKMSEITFGKWGIRDKAFVRLPNTIEEERFQVGAEDLDRREANDPPVFLVSARLIEKLKGIVNFFDAIGDERIRQARFVIAGDGPDRGALEAFVAARGLGNHITVLGHCESDALVEQYRRANVFLLPSFSDQSPLTLVEALVMKLPVLVSERCGNHFEAVADERNGYLLDPFDPESARRAFDALMARRAEWRAMGEVSAELYCRTFSRRTAIADFMRSLTEVSLAQRAAGVP